MDFSDYLKKGSSKYTSERLTRKCLNCGKVLERDLHYLYLQSFCSEKCKQEYIAGGSFK